LSSKREIQSSFSSDITLLFSLWVQDHPELAGCIKPDGGGTKLLVGEAGAVVVELGSSFCEIAILCNIPQPYTMRVCELLLLTATELDECARLWSGGAVRSSPSERLWSGGATTMTRSSMAHVAWCY
jgi:hypothetical protein